MSFPPIGFSDSFGYDAYQKYRIMNYFQNYFINLNFNPISTSVIEEEINTITDLDKNYDDNHAVKFRDPVTQKNCVFRTDITKQIGRIFNNKSLDSEKEKISYLGDIIKINNHIYGGKRQLTQSGIEIINSNNIVDDLEVVFCTLNSIVNLGVEGLVIEFNIPVLTRYILNQLLDNINDLDIEDLSLKNYPALLKKYPILNDIININIDSIKKIYEIIEDKEMQNYLINLEIIINKISLYFGDNVKILIDLLDYSKLEHNYHTNLSFNIYLSGNNNLISSGGRYIIYSNNGNIDSVGSAIYIDNIIESLTKITDERKKLAVKFNEDLKLLNELILSGEYNIILIPEECEDIKHYMQNNDVNLLFQDNKIVDITA